MGHKLIIAPAAEPVTLAEIKADLGIEHTDDDARLERLITEARQSIDGPQRWLGRALMTQTWELYLDGFPAAEIQLPVAPVQSITSVKYDDTEGVETTVDPEDYALDAESEPPWLFPVSGWADQTLEAFNAVRIRYVAGYANAAAVPGPIKQAIRIMVADAYDGTNNRDAIHDLLTQFRLFLA